MRTITCALVVVLAATPVFAQFAPGAVDRARNKAAAEAGAAKAKPPEPPVDPNAAAPAAGDAAGGASDAIFAALDADGDGTISKAELKKAITALKKLDADNDGNITRAECGLGAAAAGGAPPAGQNANADATQWMDRIMANDKNKDGKLSPNELNENEKQMLQNADANKDGFIDRDELQAFVNNQNALNGAMNAFGGAANAGRNGGRGGNEAMGFFLKYDLNQDGKLSADELPPQMARSMSGADLNHDGFIDAKEFQAMAAQMGDRARTLGAGAGPTTPAYGGYRARRP